MFETTRAYDRIVVDDPDAPSSPQYDDEEEQKPMHIYVGVYRHKMPHDRATTSCGLSWHAARDPFEPPSTWMDGGAAVLCVECFPKFERDKAAAEFARAKTPEDFAPLNHKSTTPTVRMRVIRGGDTTTPRKKSPK